MKLVCDQIRRLIACAAVSAWLVTTSALAQTMPPAPTGWTSQVKNGATVLTAPGGETDRPALMFLPTELPQGDAKDWFGNRVLTVSRSGGKPLSATETLEKDGVFLRVIELEDATHRNLRLAFYGYPTANGMNVAVLVVPNGISDQDSRLKEAGQYVRQLAAQKIEMSGAAPANGPAPSASAQQASPGSTGPVRNSRGQYVGQFGRSDIDLTYHAKAIPPKDRDVPLKGVYLFVGFAFGATYGGVSTTMTWGQSAVQQLLLLYENGVAAKVDLRGGNLAGKYQAEGFVSLDVANSAAVTGAPFGRWAEDDKSVHIQWNVGGPTDLLKNGATLEGKGETWKPYRLADGEVLEGTFVRKMEAGLKSQWIVLKRDGTFAGDGVNVTMGGSAVNPAFPQRGGGNYEIRKGSMILYFSNGFTQAIACTLDRANTGDVQKVLLNGFPFERAR